MTRALAPGRRVGRLWHQPSRALWRRRQSVAARAPLLNHCKVDCPMDWPNTAAYHASLERHDATRISSRVDGIQWMARVCATILNSSERDQECEIHLRTDISSPRTVRGTHSRGCHRFTMRVYPSALNTWLNVGFTYYPKLIFPSSSDRLKIDVRALFSMYIISYDSFQVGQKECSSRNPLTSGHSIRLNWASD